jgi:hypothetical protein
MAPAKSSVNEAVTGPAPDEVEMMVTRYDASSMNYQLAERLNGSQVASAAYTLSFSGGQSESRIDGRRQNVEASRAANGDVMVLTAKSGDLRAVIHIRQIGADAAVLDHSVLSPSGELQVEEFYMVRRVARPIPKIDRPTVEVEAVGTSSGTR